MITISNLSAQRIGYDWIRTFNNSSELVSIIDKTDNIVISGNNFLAKLDLEGNQIWLIHDTLPNTAAISIDNENNIYLTGTNTQYTPINQYDYVATSYIYIYKYNGLGNKIWTAKSGTQTTDQGGYNFVTSITLDSSNSIYISGSYTDSISFDNYQLSDNNSSAIFIAKYDSSGKVKWAEKILGQIQMMD